MPELKPVEIERVRYRQGQMLRAGDFVVQEATAGHLHAWHNRALHSAFGVARGFTVDLEVDSAGEPAGLTVACGVAYDCFGNKLVLQKDRRLVLPDKGSLEGGIWELLVRHREPQRSICEPAAHTLCPPGPHSLIEQEVEFVWRPFGWTDPREGLSLARLQLSNGGIELDPDYRALTTQPLARPRLATGSTIPGNTSWEPWTVGGSVVGLQAAIDTSSAGFTRTPHYTATLLQDAHEGRPLLFALTHIASPSARGFTFRVLLARLPQQSYEVAAASASVNAVEGNAVVTDSVASFRVGDVVDLIAGEAGAEEGATDSQALVLTAKVTAIDDKKRILTLDSDIPSAPDLKTLRLARLHPEQTQVRLIGPAHLAPRDRLLLHSRVEVEGIRQVSIVEVESVSHQIEGDDPLHPEIVHNFVTINPPSTTEIPTFNYTPGNFIVAAILNPELVHFPVLARRLNWYVCWAGCEPGATTPKECPGRDEQPHPCFEKPPCEALT